MLQQSHLYLLEIFYNFKKALKSIMFCKLNSFTLRQPHLELNTEIISVYIGAI